MFGVYTYMVWMLVFTLLAIGILWVRYYPILWKNRKIIAITSVIAIAYQIAVDPIAESWHAWFFGTDRILGLWIFNFPIEDTVFFVLVAIAVSSFVVSRAARGK